MAWTSRSLISSTCDPLLTDVIWVNVDPASVDLNSPYVKGSNPVDNDLLCQVVPIAANTWASVPALLSWS